MNIPVMLMPSVKPIPYYFVIIGLTIWCILDPQMAWAYYLFPIGGLYIGYHLISYLLSRDRLITDQKLGLTDDEKLAVSKYFDHCQYTLSSINTSGVIGSVYLSAIVLAVWYAYQGMYLQAIGFVIVILAAARLTDWYNPINRLIGAAKKGDTEAKKTIYSIRSAIAKINGFELKS